ncbi:ankyrin repeat-containing protein ITN1-like [Cornus florida]|uniref:ankyrin repeat-containing protein ITN1-like n=1 Tax=Cornus florida TaxID=4283 RepID=UPI0028977902|nr:ankyrin repeat-containing protein ITN1-like [Cornus florida]
MRLEESTIGFGDPCCNNGLDRLGLLLKQKLPSVFWKVAEMIVPQLENIRETKWKHYHAIRLVGYLCMELEFGPISTLAEDVMQNALITAATSGIPEIVSKIILRFPKEIHYKNNEGQNLFHITILNRRRNVFKLICQLCHKIDLRTILSSPNSSDKTCLDMVACLNSEQKLNLKTQAAGAALQMQLELQWFQEVKKLSILYGSKRAGKSHEMIFSETHEDLLKEGEKWLKAKANSCTIVATLIVTIVFAAAITVPGGNDSNSGHPIFSRNKAFILFIISDALALYSSTSSLLLFLSILTSRYAEIDFLHTLPKRLIFGLVTLLFSIVSMMTAFGATLFVVFGHKKAWILGPISVFSIVPVISFVSSQFPLLRDMIKSTYGGGIFGKLNDGLLFS